MWHRDRDPCPWHKGQHTFWDCPKRCYASVEKTAPGLRYVLSRHRCHGKVNFTTGRCPNWHDNSGRLRSLGLMPPEVKP